MNGIKKGARLVREFRTILEKRGFICHVPIWNRFGEKDVFNIADILAKKPGKPFTYYFQVSTKWKPKEWRDRVKNFPWNNQDFVFMVMRPDRKHFSAMVYNEEEKQFIKTSIEVL